MAKLKLDWEADDYEFELIGICSSIADYRLCWEMNKKLGINLFRGDDYSLKSKREGEYFFSFFEFYDETTNEEFYLIKNQSYDFKKLIPEQDKIDYFLIIKNNYSYNIESLIAKLKEIESILTAFSFSADELKSKSNLIF